SSAASSEATTGPIRGPLRPSGGRAFLFGFSKPPRAGTLRPMTSRRFLMLLLAALPVAPLHAGGKKDSQAKISFHIQADRNENPKMIFPQLTNGRQLFYRRMSEVNE